MSSTLTELMVGYEDATSLVAQQAYTNRIAYLLEQIHRHPTVEDIGELLDALSYSLQHVNTKWSEAIDTYKARIK
jgi:HEPN domain-containing protein